MSSMELAIGIIIGYAFLSLFFVGLAWNDWQFIDKFSVQGKKFITLVIGLLWPVLVIGWLVVTLLGLLAGLALLVPKFARFMLDALKGAPEVFSYLIRNVPRRTQIRSEPTTIPVTKIIDRKDSK